MGMAEELNVGQAIETLRGYPKDAIVVVESSNCGLWPASFDLWAAKRLPDGRLTEDWCHSSDDVTGEKVKVVVVS